MATLSGYAATVSQTLIAQSPVQLGDDSSDLVGFFGTAPAARPSGATQSVVSTGLISSISTGIASAVSTGTASGVASGYATLLITNSPGSALGVFSTVANLTATLNAINAIITALDTLGTAHNNVKTQLDLSGTAINQAKAQVDAGDNLTNALRNALSQTSGVGLIKGTS